MKLLHFWNILFFCCSFFILQSCGSGQGPKDYSVYSSETYGFKLSFPQGWNFKQDTGSPAFSFEAPVTDEFRAEFTVIIDSADPDIINVPKEFFAEANKINYEGFVLLDFQKRSFAGQECLIMLYDSESGFGKMRQKQYIFNHGDNLFIFIFAALEKNYENYSQTFEKIANSFEFTDGN